MSHTFKNQFPADFNVSPVLVKALDTDGWEDTSWGNDVCPSFECEGLRLWVEHPDPDQRESSGKRFCVTQRVEQDGDTVDGPEVFATNDEREILLWLAHRNLERFVARYADRLGAVATERLEYIACLIGGVVNDPAWQEQAAVCRAGRAGPGPPCHWSGAKGVRR